LKKYSKYLLLPAVVVYLLEDHFLQVEFLKPVALSIFILFIAYNFKALNTFGKYGDFSYGIYLIHFPVIQALIEFGVFPQNPAYFLAISIVLVLVLGICSWHLVEKPSLITFKKLANKQLR
jgi:peptidoglycan/LPS O-acetylase OafA/YrhL